MVASNYLQLHVMRVSEHFLEPLHIICLGPDELHLPSPKTSPRMKTTLADNHRTI